MSKPPVLFVVPQTDTEANGGIVSIGEVITRMRDHRPIVVTNRMTATTQQWQGDGIEIHVVPLSATSFIRNPIGRLAGYWRYARELRRLVASTGARVVHANGPFALQLALPTKAVGAKIALNLRGTSDPDRRMSSSRFRLLFAAADHILFLSNEMADHWASIAPNARKSFTVTYSIADPGKFRPLPAYAGDGPPVVLLAGVVRSLKGQLEFLRFVAPRLAEAGIETWIAGDFDPSKDSYMAACAKAAEPLRKAVKFLGFRSDMPDLLARAAVVAVTSRHEGLVRAMVEAMSSARPVVSFDVCSARELLEEQSGGAGTVVRAGDYDGMSEAIIRYCSDPALALKAAEAGAETASRLFAPDSVVRRYEQVYQMLGG